MELTENYKNKILAASKVPNSELQTTIPSPLPPGGPFQVQK